MVTQKQSPSLSCKRVGNPIHRHSSTSMEMHLKPYTLGENRMMTWNPCTFKSILFIEEKQNKPSTFPHTHGFNHHRSPAAPHLKILVVGSTGLLQQHLASKCHASALQVPFGSICKLGHSTFAVVVKNSFFEILKDMKIGLLKWESEGYMKKNEMLWMSLNSKVHEQVASRVG